MPDIRQAKILIMATDGFEQSELEDPPRGGPVSPSHPHIGERKRRMFTNMAEADTTLRG
jgi:hypothetical protein